MSFQVKAPSRDNEWLEERFYQLHARFFPDVTIENRLIVRFGRKSIRRFGSIIAKKVTGESQIVTFITINRLFVHESVPVAVIDATLLHEFAHYTHGFHSPRRKLYTHPHRGDIVGKEIRMRGAGSILTTQEEWVRTQYRDFLTKYYAIL